MGMKLMEISLGCVSFFFLLRRLAFLPGVFTWRFYLTFHNLFNRESQNDKL